jgi:hypothetical protein
VSLDRARYDQEDRADDDPRLAASIELFRQLVERAEALPSVEGAAGTTALFLSATPNSTIFTIEGRPAPRPEDRVEVPVDAVTDGCFACSRFLSSPAASSTPAMLRTHRRW